MDPCLNPEHDIDTHDEHPDHDIPMGCQEGFAEITYEQQQRLHNFRKVLSFCYGRPIQRKKARSDQQPKKE